MRFIKYIIIICFTSFGFKTSFGHDLNIPYQYNNISNISSCVTQEDTYYNYDFKVVLKSGDSNIWKVSFLYNILDKFSSPSLFLKDKNKILASSKLESGCINSLGFDQKKYFLTASSIKNANHMVSVGCPKGYLYSFSNSLGSMTCFNKKTKKLGEIYYSGTLFNKKPSVKYQSVRCDNGRFFKIGGQFFYDTYLEGNINWTTWLCLKKNSIDYLKFQNYYDADKDSFKYDVNKESEDPKLENVYMSCFDRDWYRHITNTGYKSDDLFSHIEYFANLCAAPVSNKKITFLVGCPSDKEKGHADSWNGILCNDFNSYIYISSINGKYLNHPIGYDSLRCWSGGYWVQLDKEMYKNKKTNGFKKDGFIWQKWGCVKEERFLDKVRRIL